MARQNESEFKRNLWRQRKIDGLCVECGKERDCEILVCQKCRERKKIYAQKSAKRRILKFVLAGLCTLCGGIRDGYHRYCSKCRQHENQRRNHRRKNINQQNKNYQIKNKLICFEKYGHHCGCCGESKIEFLTIDHMIKPISRKNGNKQRSGAEFYRWLKLQNYPPGYRVLCLNCNFSIGHFGYCPHKG